MVVNPEAGFFKFQKAWFCIINNLAFFGTNN